MDQQTRHSALTNFFDLPFHIFRRMDRALVRRRCEKFFFDHGARRNPWHIGKEHQASRALDERQDTPCLELVPDVRHWMLITHCRRPAIAPNAKTDRNLDLRSDFGQCGIADPKSFGLRSIV